jgi:osmotically-inducible protein OsmY
LPASDIAIRDRLTSHLKAQPWAHTGLINVIVNDGVVDLWGFVSSSTEKKAVRVAAESTPGVRVVNDHLVVRAIAID